MSHSKEILLTVDKSMLQWLEEKRKLLRLRTVQSVIRMVIGSKIAAETEAQIFGD